MRKWLLPTIAIPVVLAIVGFTYAQRNTILLTQTSVDKVIKAAHFPVKKPTFLPFCVIQSWGQITTVVKGDSNNTEISIVYAGKGNSMAEYVAPTGSGLIKIPYHQPTVYMSNGRTATYVKGSGTLFWQQGNEIYNLIVHPYNLLSESELIKIADSVK
ncbi:hypothetical protein AN477_07805 [Alicyclobacillus ferrooxydans]|uniref:DUF4367 domain-containing protein n=2 Tax=Alicyclobacillus ferrooxydans TaxID=471514 RepID=A0A0N8PPH0_9BACL|nr:hypothetical protein AN477_07805 [Alicyclobacillus ferrooxydans]